MRFRARSRSASDATSEEAGPYPGGQEAAPEPEQAQLASGGEQSGDGIPTSPPAAWQPGAGMPGRTEEERRAELAALRNPGLAAGADADGTPEGSIGS
jgi:hypothetical protein